MRLILCALALFMGVNVHAMHDNKKMDAKQKEMMKAWEKYAKPKDEHKTLAKMAGNWTYSAKMWEHATATPQASTGTSTMEMILGERFLQQKFVGKMMGHDFEGFGLVGYDNLKQKYNTVFIDTMGTGMMLGNGSYNKSTKTLTDEGSYSCPMSKSKERSYRTELKIASNDSMTFTMYGQGIDNESPEFKQMEIIYTRVK